MIQMHSPELWVDTLVLWRLRSKWLLVARQEEERLQPIIPSG